MINREDFERFIKTKTSLSKNSIRHCLSRCYIYLDWLELYKKNLNKISCEEFIFQLKEKGRNNNTLNTYVFALRYLKNYLTDRGVETDFFDGLGSFKKVSPQIIFLSQEEVERLIHADTTSRGYTGEKIQKLQFTNQTLRMFLSYTGVSFDEANRLKVKFVDLPNRKILMKREKNQNIRHLYITEPLLSRLRTLLEKKTGEDLVFTNLRGRKIYATDFGVDLRKAAKLAGITKRVHCHLLRHTYATYLYSATRDVGVVKEVLGHRDIKSTMVYVHIADEIIKEGMLCHPFVRGNINPKEFINLVEQAISRFKLEEDKRFDYLKIKDVIHQFTTGLYAAIIV